MKVRLLSMGIVLAMISTLSGTSVFARAASDPLPSGEEVKASPEKAPTTKEKTREVKLKGDIAKASGRRQGGQGSAAASAITKRWAAQPFNRRENRNYRRDRRRHLRHNCDSPGQ